MSEARILDPEMEAREEEQLDQVAVLDDTSAEMILMQLKAAQQQYERMDAWYDQQKKKAKEIYERTRFWAESCLRPYFDMVPTTGKKILTYDMPGGTMKLSIQDPKYDVQDDQLVPWLEKNNLADMVAIKKEARWGEFKKTIKGKNGIQTAEDENGILRVVTPDGELVPGVTVTNREPKFTVTVK